MIGRKKPQPQSEPTVDETNAVDESAETTIEEQLTIDPSDEVDATQALIEQLEEERDSAKDQYQRALADYSNFQKRSVQNERNAAQIARQDMMRDLLPILDNFDLALEHAATSEFEGPADQLYQGVQMVRDGLMQMLEQRNLTSIAAEPGVEFDPNQHEAVMMQPTDEMEPNHIVTLVQVGYALGETVLRPAKVIIAKAVPAEDVDADKSASDSDESK